MYQEWTALFFFSCTNWNRKLIKDKDVIWIENLRYLILFYNVTINNFEWRISIKPPNYQASTSAEYGNSCLLKRLEIICVIVLRFFCSFNFYQNMIINKRNISQLATVPKTHSLNLNTLCMAYSCYCRWKYT